jgi:peptide chain release factor 3
MSAWRAASYTGARWITADTPAELQRVHQRLPAAHGHAMRPTPWPTCAPRPHDVRLAQERFPKIHFPPTARACGLGFGDQLHKTHRA